MIDRNRVEDTDVQLQLRRALLGRVVLDTLKLSGRSLEPAINHYINTIRCLDDLEEQVAPYAFEHQQLVADTGHAAFEAGDYELARRAWAEAAKMRNTDTDTRFYLGVLCMGLGEPAQAEHALYGGSIASLFNIDTFEATGDQRVKEGNDPGARSAFASAQYSREFAATMFLALGEARLQQGKYVAAARALERSRALDPNLGEVEERLAVANKHIVTEKNRLAE